MRFDVDETMSILRKQRSDVRVQNNAGADISMVQSGVAMKMASSGLYIGIGTPHRILAIQRCADFPVCECDEDCGFGRRSRRDR